MLETSYINNYFKVIIISYFMKIAIGSENPVKIKAVLEELRDYKFFDDSEIFYFDVNSGVEKQPVTEEQTYLGAQNRAIEAYNGIKNCDYGIGIESGIRKIPLTHPHDLKCYVFSVCTIYDGRYKYEGTSINVPIPQEITWYIFNKRGNLEEAAKSSGWTKKERIGREEGIISILTDGRLNRKKYTKHALRAALAELLKFSVDSSKQQII